MRFPLGARVYRSIVFPSPRVRWFFGRSMILFRSTPTKYKTFTPTPTCVTVQKRYVGRPAYFTTAKQYPEWFNHVTIRWFRVRVEIKSGDLDELYERAFSSLNKMDVERREKSRVAKCGLVLAKNLRNWAQPLGSRACLSYHCYTTSHTHHVMPYLSCPDSMRNPSLSSSRDSVPLPSASCGVRCVSDIPRGKRGAIGRAAQFALRKRRFDSARERACSSNYTYSANTA